MKYCRAVLLLVFLACMAGGVRAEQAVRLGILAFRPKPQALAQWQPLASYLQTELGSPVELSVYDLPGMEAAVAKGSLDVVFTNPGQYILLNQRYALSAPLATQVNAVDSIELASFGGVIFTRADASAINVLADVPQKRIALSDTTFLGGYQIQAFELQQAGLPLPDAGALLVTGMPQDLAVEAVLARRADVGFVRTGVLEAMAHEGRLDSASFKIINRQSLATFPYASSTRLVPEWPVAVTATADPRLARRLAVALFALQRDSPAALSAGLMGFTVPAHYGEVDKMLRSVRLPPFDAAPEIGVADLWQQYQAWMVALGILTVLLAGTGAGLLAQNRRMRHAKQRTRAIIQSALDAIVQMDAHGVITGWNPQAERLFGWSQVEAVGRTMHETIIPAHYRDAHRQGLSRHLRTGSAHIMGTVVEVQAMHRDGRVFPIELIVTSIGLEGAREFNAFIRDISERLSARKALQESNLRYSSLVERSPVAIAVHRDGVIAYANPAAVAMVGAPSAGALLGSPFLDRVHPDYHALVAERLAAVTVVGETSPMVEEKYIKFDGSVIDVEVQGTLIEYEGSPAYQLSARNITERKQLESTLRFLAHSSGVKGGEGFFPELARYLARTLGADYVCIDRLGDDGQVTKTVTVFQDGSWDAALCCALGADVRAASLGHEVLTFTRGVRQHFSADAALRQLRAEAYMGITLCSADGQAIGLIAVVSRKPMGNVAPAQAILKMVAVRAAGELELESAQARLHLAGSVFTNAREGILITDASGTIVDVNDTFGTITGYSRAESIGQNPRLLKSGRQGPQFYAAMWAQITQRGFWSGEIWNRRKNGEIYAVLESISAVRDADGVIQNYVGLFTDITAIKDHQRQLDHIAHYDVLTGLPNRVLLADRLQQAMAHCQRHEHTLALAYFDLDGFKAVNDAHGRAAGDGLLVAVAHNIAATLRDGDTLARIGGDEFVALLVDVDPILEIETVLARLLGAAATPATVADVTFHISASIGVTIYPQDGADADQLMRHADQAMYLAKQAGKNRYHLFDVAQDAAVQTQRESLEHIRQALNQNEFVLFYQPKVNIRTGAVIGAEALIRWQHPERGLLAPAAFLPVIEEHPLSVEVGEWVIASALAQMSTWYAAGLDVPVSVNIGACQLQQEGFAQRLGEALAAHPGVPPYCLELEILETSALEDIRAVVDVMVACQAMGVRFALDDFGTGYSSLTYLRHLPAEMIKIDQSFVRDMMVDPDDLAIVKGVIGLAAAFQRNVIAEGVETAVHGMQLLALGAELAQGYGIARPMPADQIEGWVARWRKDAAWQA